MRYARYAMLETNYNLFDSSAKNTERPTMTATIILLVIGT